MKKFVLYFLSFILILSILIGCENNKPSKENFNKKENETTLSGKIFRAAMTASPMSLDEGYSTNAHTRQISPFIFETLFTFDEEYNVIPQMVDTYKISDDGLVYDLKLRENIKFHDGSDFTSEDVIASIKRFRSTIQYGKQLDAIINMKQVDDYDVKITLDKPIGLLPALAFLPRCIMLPKEVAERNMTSELKGKDIIGSGPYKLVEWTPDVHIKLERFDNYSADSRYDDKTGLGGKRIPYFKTIYIVPVPEAEARITGLETGEYDYAESIPNTSYDRILKNNDLSAEVVKPRWSIAVEFNHLNWPCSDVNFRRALVYALDMNEVLTAVASGNKEFYRLDPSIYTPEQFFYIEGTGSDIYNKKDLDKVKELLKKANYNGEEVIYLVNKDFDFMYKACLSIAEQWKNAGINVKMEFSDWPTQISKAESMQGWNINQTGLSPRLDINQMSSELRSGVTGSYGYSNPEVDELFDQFNLNSSNIERKKLWKQVQDIIWNDIPLIKIGDFFELEAINSKYKGYSSFYFARFWNVTDK